MVARTKRKTPHRAVGVALRGEPQCGLSAWQGREAKPCEGWSPRLRLLLAHLLGLWAAFAVRAPPNLAAAGAPITFTHTRLLEMKNLNSPSVQARAGALNYSMKGDAKDNAKAQRNTKVTKKKPQITQISTDFFCVLCKFLYPLWLSPYYPNPSVPQSLNPSLSVSSVVSIAGVFTPASTQCNRAGGARGWGDASAAGLCVQFGGCARALDRTVAPLPQGFAADCRSTRSAGG